MDNKKKEKSEGEKLAEKLLSDKKNGGLRLSEEKLKKADKFCEGYKSFLNKAKTEREAVKAATQMAKANGFSEFCRGKSYKAGDKVYINNRGKTLALAVIGEQPVEQGVNITAAHIDSPRLDLKPNPLYEDTDLALFKTHYYGGIKKYQWVTIPLILCGKIFKKDGSSIDVLIGKDKNDPIFYISDLLPHLASEQEKKPLYNAISGEDLNVIIGTRYEKKSDGKTDKEKNKTDNSDTPKYYAMKLLNEKYGITEEDFYTAELSFVPNYEARDVGLDRSLIASAGHDDRVCCYPAISAIFDKISSKKTSVVLLADKEEIGSIGITGMRSVFWYDVLSSMIENMI